MNCMSTALMSLSQTQSVTEIQSLYTVNLMQSYSNLNVLAPHGVCSLNIESTYSGWPVHPS